MGRVRTQIAPAGPRPVLERLGIEALRSQDRSLGARSTEGVLADEAVAPNDAMAGDHQRHRVVGQRRPDRPDGLRAPDLGGDPAVRPDLAAGDLEGLHPDRDLEFRATPEVERDADPAVAGQASLDGSRQLGRDGFAPMDRATNPFDEAAPRRPWDLRPDRPTRCPGRSRPRRRARAGTGARRIDRRGPRPRAWPAGERQEPARRAREGRPRGHRRPERRR